MNNNNNNVDVSRKQQQQRFYRLKYSDVKNDDNNNTTKMLKTKKIMESNNNNNNNNVIEKDLLKVVVIGESGSGKSNLIQRLVNDRFEERLPSTIGIDFALYQFKLNSLFDKNRQQTYHAQIWDTAGMERYRSSMTKIFYRDVDGALLVFDLTRRDHFQALPRWLQEIRNNVHKHNSIDDDDDDDDYDNRDDNADNIQIPIILVGNKIDLFKSREIDRNEAIKFAQKYHCVSYVETSAKNSTNVHEAFQQLFDHILEQKRLNYYRQQQQQQQYAAKLKSKNSTKSKSKSKQPQQRSTTNQNSIRLTRDPNYLEQRSRIKEKKKSGCSC
nr:ras-related protein Rab-18-like [Dermatophagoides pteronyssinus]